MAQRRESFLRFALRGVAIGAALVVLFVVASLLLLFYGLPDGWNE